MAERFEGNFKGHGDSDLFFQLWKVEDPRGTIVVTHGLAEHSECYAAFAASLNKFNWDVYAWDLRGHGRSEGKRGYVADFHEFEKDLKRFIDLVKKNCHGQSPFVLFGHSLGGLITLKTLLDDNSLKPSAVALSSPALGLAVQVPKVKEVAAQWAARWLPTLTMWNEIRYENLTRDEEMIQQYDVDPLRHDKISPCLYLGMVEAQKEVQARSAEITCPLLMLVSGHDKIVSAQASIDFFEKIGSEIKEIHIYADSYHEIFNDLENDRVYHDLKVFLNQL